MFNNLIKNYISNHEDSTTTINPLVSNDTRVEIECQQFLPEVSDTWTSIHKLSADTTRFREIYDLYKYERSKNQQKYYFDQLKILDDTIYKLSLTIHQRIQSLERIVQPTLNEFRINEQEKLNNYKPAYIRIAQNQLNSLKLSFKRIITKHNSDSIDYQNDLKQSLENSKSSTIDEGNMHITPNISQEQIQLQISEETQIADLEARLESIRVLKDRVRQMNEMTMALYISVQEQNELTDNIWLNTSAGSDYIAQSVDEFHLVKKLKQSKMNLWIKLICITFCFLLILLLILILILILNQK